MMKTLNKALHALTALALLLMLTLPAFAVEAYSITISNDSSTTGVSIAGNTYTAYKLFSVTYDGDTSTAPHSYTYDSTCLNVEYIPSGESSALSGDSLIAWLRSQASNSSDLQNFADYVYTNYIQGKTNLDPATTKTGTVTVGAGSETATINLGSDPETSPGYYLVYGTGGSGDTTVVASVSLTTTDPTAEVTPKLSVPTLTKQIQHNELNSWSNVGDNQIGDTVEYRTITTVPDTNNYTSYTYMIHDTMSDGLTFNPSSLAVKINDGSKTLTLGTDYTVSSDVHSFTIMFKNIMDTVKTNSLTTSDHFYVYYDATLNENAKVYTAGHNDNTAWLEYSNNPYDTGTGESPKVTVYDWTFTMGVNKVDSDSSPLSGAEFVLNKHDGSSTADPIKLIYNADDQSYTVAPSGYTGTTTTTTISAGNIHIKGLDDATNYYLHETKAPDGYNLLSDPVSFTISANYVTAGNALDTGHPSVVVGNSPSSTTLSTDVVNLTGNELPTTGGMGTRMFYAVGGTLTAGAGIAFVTRKRIRDEK